MTSSTRIIQLEEGWNNVIKAKGITKLEDALDRGLQSDLSKIITKKDNLLIYTTSYDMCNQRNPYNYSRELYQRHGETIERYLKTTVYPALLGKEETILLTELQHRWVNHKIMNEWMRKFVRYLDRYWVGKNAQPTLEQAGLLRFKTIIYDEIKQYTTEAVLNLITRERDGMIIDKSLIKSVVEIYESMGMDMGAGSLDSYNTDFEEALIKNTREYYSTKRIEWSNYSTPAYLNKAEEARNSERLSVAGYLNSETQSKILEIVDEEILDSIDIVLFCKNLLPWL